MYLCCIYWYNYTTILFWTLYQICWMKAHIRHTNMLYYSVGSGVFSELFKTVCRYDGVLYVK